MRCSNFEHRILKLKLKKSNEKIGKQLSINSETGNLEEVDELRRLIGKEFENGF
mgnify:CR=1 FL=1